MKPHFLRNKGGREWENMKEKWIKKMDQAKKVKTKGGRITDSVGSEIKQWA